jgi:hypothetical protein
MGLGDQQAVAGDVFLLCPNAWYGYAQAKKLGLYSCCSDTALLGRKFAWPTMPKAEVCFGVFRFLTDSME